MGLVFSQDSEAVKKYEKDLKLWQETISAIEEHERQEWKKVTPGCCRLTVYWVQMLLCLVEGVPRFLFHAFAFLLVLPFYLLECLVLFCFAQCQASSQSPAEVAVRGAASVAAVSMVAPAAKQLAHHQFWAMMYFDHLPRLVFYNLCNPSQPFFADGVDITVYRPVQPQPPPRDICEACCNPLCLNCGLLCQPICVAFEAISIRYFRSSYFFLGGYHAFQCGSCLGPCIRPLCYDPCVGGDTESGRCRACEVDEIRVARWMREAHEAKAARSEAFYAARPHLMRPPDELMAVVRTPKAASAAAARPAVVGHQQP